MTNFLLAIDQGTTSTRAMLFNDSFDIVAQAQEQIGQIYPAPGLVEHDPEAIWSSVLSTVRSATSGFDCSQIAGVGLTNQRETTVLWDRSTGRVLHNAIVWQDRRTADYCSELAKDDEGLFAQTGLRPDPYFSGTKLRWLLENIPGARRLAAEGQLAFGTIDTFLIWRLTGGKVHATDATNASRTMLYDIVAGAWDPELCRRLEIPMSLLPEVKDSSDDFGCLTPDIVGVALPICGVAGDQQAAAIGQGCLEPGMAKATFGTGCFMLLNTGEHFVRSQHRLISTIASRIDGKVKYALEGSIFIAGAAVQWLRDGLGAVADVHEVDALVSAAAGDSEVVLVPAFTGLGAPYWVPDCRGAILGLSRGTGRSEVARATLESIGFQARDLVDAMEADLASTGTKINSMRIDGGASASEFAMQFVADMISMPVDRPENREASVTGAAWLAGTHLGLCAAATPCSASTRLDRRFEPTMPAAQRSHKYLSWRSAVKAVLSYHVG